MATPFAALETRLNVACLAALANADATLPDLTVVSGVFESGAVAGGVFEVSPAFLVRFTASSDALTDVEVGDEIYIRSRLYRVTAIEPDGTGMTVLGLK